MNNKTYKSGRKIDRLHAPIIKSDLLINRPSGENIIKTEIILNAWLRYCRESRIYRILEWFGLR